ncbi:hypothetical protein L5515_009768 [Caenorhabditis briggsae]|uniref:Uncharacterized protein n=2 Tax=Caenorhabditis briggsae TaxID=6238 RepID=A0AAE9JMQ0_CAEBR|nr:hypothetical protein L5515_009768 [Caenorhabditis briggsae]
MVLNSLVFSSPPSEPIETIGRLGPGRPQDLHPFVIAAQNIYQTSLYTPHYDGQGCYFLKIVQKMEPDIVVSGCCVREHIETPENMNALDHDRRKWVIIGMDDWYSKAIDRCNEVFLRSWVQVTEYPRFLAIWVPLINLVDDFQFCFLERDLQRLQKFRESYVENSVVLERHLNELIFGFRPPLANVRREKRKNVLMNWLDRIKGICAQILLVDSFATGALSNWDETSLHRTVIRVIKIVKATETSAELISCGCFYIENGIGIPENPSCTQFCDCN